MALTGCVSVPGIQDRYVVCSYDQAWEAALEAMKDRALTVRDKEKGLIETGWLEVPVDPRFYGAFHREIKDSRDRSKLVLTLKQIQDVTQVSLTEDRERWAWRGGSRMFGWTPADPSEEAINSTMNRVQAKLKERGCSRT